MRSTAGRGHLGAGHPEETEGLTDEDNKCHVELAFSYEMADMVDHGTNQNIKTDEVLVVRYDRQGCLLEVVIEREMNVLTAEELRAHKAEVNTACLDEIKRWLSMDMFERSKRRDATYLVDSRWVIKFKLVNGVKMIKARLTVRGFKDREAGSLNTFAGTASRWGQRATCAVIAQNKWTLWSADVSMALLRGKSFKELAAQTGSRVRSI